MESLFKKLKTRFAPEYYEDEYAEEEYYEDDYVDEEEEDTRPMRVVPRRQQDRQTTSNFVAAPKKTNNLIQLNPKRLDDMVKVSECLRAGKSVILVFDSVSEQLQQRMIDVTAGIVHALDCTFTMVSDNVSVIVPSGVNFTGI